MFEDVDADEERKQETKGSGWRRYIHGGMGEAMDEALPAMTQKGHAPGTKQARASPKSNTALRGRWGFGRVGMVVCRDSGN